MQNQPDKDTERVIDEVRLLWNALVRRGEQLHHREEITMGMRAILEFLLRNGPTTVPNIARNRGVTRQHVQALVNPLLEQRLVKATDNPAHRRSSLIELTARGQRSIERMRKREAAVFEDATPDISSNALTQAAGTLRQLRQAIESSETRKR
ncbi:MAG: MarR family transcriptional regulator [bacterium]|nr:MarR family transcriptional regulator [bacterium]